MRKKLLSLILVGLGVLVLLAGLASATVFKPDNKVTLSTPKIEESSYITASAEVLALVNKTVTVSATVPADQEITVIIGRTVDIAGWVGDNPSYQVTGAQDWDSLTVAPAQADASPNDSADATETANPDESSPSPSATEDAAEPANDEATADTQAATESDMWTQYYTAKGRVDLDLKGLESGMSLLAISSGDQAPSLSATWERDVTTPLVVPALIAGAVLLLAGIAAYFLAPNTTRKPSLAATTTDDTPFAVTNNDAQQAFSSVEQATPRAPREKKPSLLAKAKRERAAALEEEAHAAQSIASPSDAFKFSPLSSDSPLASGIAVDPISQPRRGGSHASAVSTHSADSTGSEDSTGSAHSALSAPSAMRKALEEPNLDTAALKQLGLTRRQLREMREAQEAATQQHTAIPQVSANAQASQQPARSDSPFTPNATASAGWANSSSSATPVTTNSASELNTVEATEPQSAPAANPRTSGSNWRAAWGVRTNIAESVETERASAFSELAHVNKPSAAQNVEATPAEAASTPTAAQPFAPTPVQPFAPTPSNAQISAPRSVREPAQWWGTSADEAQTSASTPANSQSDGAAAENTAKAPAPSVREAAPASPQPTSPAPATRRALYSNYRAEAERLSAQEDWPVPAPHPDEDSSEQDGGRK